MKDPFQVVRDFEAALCDYTGAPYCVTTTSCTMALLLAVAYQLRRRQDERGRALVDHARAFGMENAEKRLREPHYVQIPKRTYVGVAQSIINAGGRPTFREERWSGFYRLAPLPVFDSARWLTAWLYGRVGDACGSQAMVCISFHHTKTLGLTAHGGAILHGNPEADEWLRRARFDGRGEGIHPSEDRIQTPAWHCYMTPATAAEGLMRLRTLPRVTTPLPWGPGTDSEYPDLSEMDCFK